MSRWPKSIVALTLAALYALIASCGHGLHCHGAACHGVACQSVGCETTCGHNSACCQGNHLSELRASLSEDNPCEKTGSKACGVLHEISGCESTILIDDCIACQLLSQIEVGFSAHEPHAGQWLNLSHPPLTNDSQIADSIDHSFDARGPPARC